MNVPRSYVTEEDMYPHHIGGPRYGRVAPEDMGSFTLGTPLEDNWRAENQRWLRDHGLAGVRSCDDEYPHEAHGYNKVTETLWYCPGVVEHSGPCIIHMKQGWTCTRGYHVDGPCALVPDDALGEHTEPWTVPRAVSAASHRRSHDVLWILLTWVLWLGVGMLIGWKILQ